MSEARFILAALANNLRVRADMTWSSQEAERTALETVADEIDEVLAMTEDQLRDWASLPEEAD